MEDRQILDRSHPSFGIDQAWFQFAITSPDGAVRKLLLVEARRPAVVATLEYLLQVDGKVSDLCHVVAVYRQCPGIGMRSDLLDESTYVDFMLDIVDPDRLLADATCATYFSQSLTDDERRYAEAKARARSTVEEEPAPPRKSAAPRTAKSREKESAYEPGGRKDMLFTALTKMGFLKPPVQKWIDSNDVESGTVQNQIRSALSALAS